MIKVPQERLVNSMGILTIAIIYIGYKFFRAWMDDVQMRNTAKKNGWNIYSSRTGLKYTDTNGKYYGSKRWYKENINKK